MNLYRKINMTDSRRWSSDPWQRLLGEQADRHREDAAKRNSFTPKPSNKPSSGSNNEIDSEAAGAAAVIGVAATAAVLATAAVAAVATIKITYEGIRRGLNIKQGLPADSTQNNEKAGWLTAGVFATAAAIGGGIYSYNEAKNKEFPSIAVAFSNRGTSFVSTHADYNQASQNALKACRENDWGLFYSCELNTATEAGSKMCVNYYNIRDMIPGHSIRHQFRNYFSISPDKKMDNTVIKANCMLTLGKYNANIRLCEQQAKTVCNFK